MLDGGRWDKQGVGCRSSWTAILAGVDGCLLCIRLIGRDALGVGSDSCLDVWGVVGKLQALLVLLSTRWIDWDALGVDRSGGCLDE